MLEVKKQALQLMTDELQQAKNDLEARVKSRTKSLEQANSQIKDALEEKDVLLREIHHRVKNNLQIVSSLLGLQARRISDKAAIDQLNEAQNRIQSIVLIHERLYLTENLARVDYDEYVRDLVGALNHSFAGDVGKVTIDIDIGDLALGVNTAVPCGLIITELVTNSFQHAFLDNGGGSITIKMAADGDDGFLLVVGDSGRGIPEGFNMNAGSNIGLQIVNSLVKQLKGTIEFDTQKGVEATIRFPSS